MGPGGGAMKTDMGMGRRRRRRGAAALCFTSSTPPCDTPLFDSSQVGVFSPSHRNHYLNVTPSNLLKIYPPDGAGSSSSSSSFSSTTPHLPPVMQVIHAHACTDAREGTRRLLSVYIVNYI